jgi:shikimate kinase
MKNIFLIGPKHSGKTSAGKTLAAQCACPFIDVDEVITEKTGKTPRALYSEGIEIFRHAETAALQFLLETKASAGGMPAVIIAAGGGITDNPAAIALIKKNKTLLTVYLDISAQTAWERICEAGELPPFLKTENPQDTHRALHERRAASCRELAELTITAQGKTPEEIAREILHTAANC